MGFLFKELLFEQPGKRLIYNKGHCRVYKRLKRVERDKAPHIAPYVALRLGQNLNLHLPQLLLFHFQVQELKVLK